MSEKRAGCIFMTNAVSNEKSTTNAELLLGFWYPALLSAQVRSRKLRSTMLAGVPLVVGRDGKGRAFALRDSCPHRGMPLSYGHFDGEFLECSYHGWQFEPASGQCKEIPSLTSQSQLKVGRIYAESFRCEEQDGYVWVFMPDPASRPDLVPPVPRLPVFSPRYRLTHLSADLPCNVDHGIIGLMDPAHGPFVHQAWWWRSRKSIHVKEKVFEPIPNGFRMREHAPSTNSGPYKLLRIYGKTITSKIDFVLPNIRLEEVHCGSRWFSSRAIVTPVTSTHSRIDFCAAWNIFSGVPFVVPIFRIFGRRFLRQDQQTMIKQAAGLQYNPPLMLIDDADRPAKWYFQLKTAYLEAKRSGRHVEHPLQAPVVLRWRS